MHGVTMKIWISVLNIGTDDWNLKIVFTQALQ